MHYLPYILFAVIVLFAALQLRVLIAACRRRGTAAPAFDDLLGEGATHTRYLLYFFSPRCGPCRAMTPRIDAVAAQHSNLIKVDVSERADVAQRFGVMATPTFVAVAHGRIERMHVGTLSEKHLRALLCASD